MTRIVDFDQPPVVETVVGVQFEQISGFKNVHLGAFWKLIQKDWPNVSDAPRLNEEFERFDQAAQFTYGFRAQLSELDAASRLMARNADNDRLIQVQNGRLHLNWVQRDGSPYPQYERVRSDFDRIWAEFSKYLELEMGAVPKPNQWEVTYVNLIPRGSPWDEIGNLGSVLSFIRSPITAPCGPLERASMELHFEIEPKRGRLHVQFSQVESVGKEAINLTLTARGPIGGSIADFGAGLDVGRDAIVRAFKLFTTKEAHKFWGEKDATHRSN